MLKKSVFGLLLVTSLFAKYERKTAVVEAVSKAKESVLALTVEYGGRETKGTGIIVDELGHFITNYHVVKNNEKIFAVTFDGEKVEAEVVRTMSKRDLALLRLKSDKVRKPMVVGNSDDIMVGETVIAIGNPYGFSNTVSIGIVSGLKREIPGPKNNMMDDVIQHSADINPGNSGGPLLNINGEWIGMNVAIRNGAQGIGFAISAETIRRCVTSRLREGILLTSSK